jgi:hypothetical protein
MTNELLQRAAADPALMQELVDALKPALGGAQVSTADDVRALMSRAANDEAFRARLADALRTFAAKKGLAFTPQPAATRELSDDELAAVAGGSDNPTQIPIGTPIALIFIAAALIFLPTIFNVAGGTIFGPTKRD